jgi:hypothetical protein
LNLSFPYVSNRRYLTGIDWLVGAMAHSARNNGGLGIYSQAVLEVEGALCEKKLRTALDQISSRFPLIHGRVSRDWRNLAPYWKVSRSARDSSIPLRVVDLPAGDAHAADRLFVDHVNISFDSERQHLRYLLVRIGQERSRLGIVFDHRFLDAFGAEVFFRLIDLTSQGRLDEIAPRVRQTEPAHADHWKRRFESGRTVNRMLFHLHKLDVSSLGLPPAGSYRPVRFVHDRLSVEETASFIRMAGEEIGVPIILPSAAARAILAMRHVFPKPPLPGSHHLVYTTTNMRPPGQEWETLLFNHISLMPFSLEADAQTTTKQAAIALRDQFFEYMKQRIPFVTEDASALGRICPHWIGSRLLELVAKGRMCSLYFACLRDPGFSGETFLDLPTVDLIHTPLATSPPGLNICMTFFRGHFNLVVSYVEGLMDDRSARQLMREFKSSLML